MGERERERESGGRKGDREEGEGESERKDELVTLTGQQLIGRIEASQLGTMKLTAV